MPFDWRHPTGGAMTLPDGWQVSATQAGLQLVPPDVAMTPQGPAELYLVSVQPAPGIARPDDPRIVGFVDQSLRQLIPFFSPPSAAEPCGPGVRVRWSAKNPMTGGEVIAVAMMQLAAGAVAGIVSIGERAKVEARLAAVEGVFASFRKGEVTRDPTLAGTWHHWSYRSAGMYTSSSISSETRRVRVLGVDGSVIERSNHEGSGSLQGLGGYASQSAGGRTGSWSGGCGTLHVDWSDGAQVEWQYRIEGMPGARRLLLYTPGQNDPVEWTEQQVNV